MLLRAAMKHAQRYFVDVGHQKLFPLTSDAVRLHIGRAHFQAMIWKQAHMTNPTLQLPETMG